MRYKLWATFVGDKYEFKLEEDRNYIYFSQDSVQEAVEYIAKQTQKEIDYLEKKLKQHKQKLQQLDEWHMNYEEKISQHQTK